MILVSTDPITPWLKARLEEQSGLRFIDGKPIMGSGIINFTRTDMPDDKTYTAKQILDQARIENMRNAVFDELFPQFQTLFEKLVVARDAGPDGDQISLTPDEAMLCYRLIMMGRRF